VLCEQPLVGMARILAPGLTTEHYGGDYELSTLKKIVDRLNYPVDLSHIHYDRFRLFQLADGKPNKRQHIVAMQLRKMESQSGVSGRRAKRGRR